jgi:HEAT repeat protein
MGQLRCQRSWLKTTDRAELREVQRQGTALAQLLSVPRAVVHQRLADNATQDSEPQVRLQNLRFLVAAGTQAPPGLLAHTARSLLNDVHPVRLLAAQQLGTEGHAVLQALAADEQVQLEQRVAAARSLGAAPTPSLGGLRALLSAPQPPEVHGAALAAVPAAGTALAPLVLSCAQSEHASVRAAAAQALGVLAQPQAEPVLRQLLTDDASEVQLASAEALGALGTVTAVESLLPLAENLLRPQLRQAARAAIQRIQSRLGNVEAGRVSLAEPGALEGAVSIATGSAALRVGDVSLIEEAAAAEAYSSDQQAQRGQV